jgi:hypothetical protein
MALNENSTPFDAGYATASSDFASKIRRFAHANMDHHATEIPLSGPGCGRFRPAT